MFCCQVNKILHTVNYDFLFSIACFRLCLPVGHELFCLSVCLSVCFLVPILLPVCLLVCPLAYWTLCPNKLLTNFIVGQ